MKKLLFSLVAACLFLSPCAAKASTNPYISLSGGLGLLNKSDAGGFADWFDWKTGYALNAAIGLQSDYARIEAAVGYQHNVMNTFNYYIWPPSSWGISLLSIMANGYLDYHIKNSGFSPYVMGGIGFAAVDLYYNNTSNTDTVFAWQLGTGVGIKAGDKLTVDIGYRYFKPDNPPKMDYTLASSNILIGVRIGI